MLLQAEQLHFDDGKSELVKDDIFDWSLVHTDQVGIVGLLGLWGDGVVVALGLSAVASQT